MNYCTPLEVIEIRNKGTVADVKQLWLDAVDGLIEQHLSQGWKGVTWVHTAMGGGGQLLRLPRPAASITSIVEQTNPVLAGEYLLEPGGRLLRRLSAGLTFYPTKPAWQRGAIYTLTYVEPDATTNPAIVPDKVRFVAADCVAEIVMWALKNKDYGVALSATDSAKANTVSTGSSTTFPASVEEEIRRRIKASLNRNWI